MQEIPRIAACDYTYDLPRERIALYPLPARDQSRLLVWRKGVITGTFFGQLDSFLPSGSMLVFNNTRVVHARLFFRKETGSRIELLCLEPNRPAHHQQALESAGPVEWKCMVGNAKKWKEGPLYLEGLAGETAFRLKAERTGNEGNAFLIRFSWDRPLPFSAILGAVGAMPIPPYLNRPAETLDEERYQTSYAKIDGSVAAPTAGLHFTREVMARLSAKGIRCQELTLHVGAGTFQPVKTDWISAHTMHTETIRVTRRFLSELKEFDGRMIAVGTTSVRALESLYWLGAREDNDYDGAPPGGQASPEKGSQELPTLGQWEPYGTTRQPEATQALQNLLRRMDAAGQEELTFSTSLMIVPGYRFRIIRGMITNFHQPQSTLLLLIAAFLGDDWKKVYDHALEGGYRFLSYGDSNLYLKD